MATKHPNPGTQEEALRDDGKRSPEVQEVEAVGRRGDRRVRRGQPGLGREARQQEVKGVPPVRRTPRARTTRSAPLGRRGNQVIKGKRTKTTVTRVLDAVGRTGLGPVEGRDVGPSDAETRKLTDEQRGGGR